MQTRMLLCGMVAVCGSLAGPLHADEGATSLKPLAAKEWDDAKAAHLLRRAGFGGTRTEIEELQQLGLDGAVDRLVDYRQIPFDPPAPPIDPLVAEPPDRAELREFTEAQRAEYQQKRRAAEKRTLEEIRAWWLERMVESPRPLEEKLTLFWHGHFTSGAREVRSSVFMKEQNDLLRRHAAGDFRELLLGISRDRAMLVYLDGAKNVKETPNENFARELLELFTLGVGNYSESDIKAAARAFTGWGFDSDGFVFRKRQHDSGPKEFLGRKGNFDGTDIIDVLLEQPACSRFLARSLLEFFVRPNPEKPLVEALAAELRRNEYKLAPTIKTLFRSRAFYHARSAGALVKSPVELVVIAARQFDLPLGDLPAAQRACAAMGQELMQPPNVKGWDGGPKWINSATLFTRYNTIGGLLADPDEGSREERPLRRMLEARRERRAARAELARSAEQRPGDQRPMAENDERNDEEVAAEMTMRGQSDDPQTRSRLGGGRQKQFDPLPVVQQLGLSTPEQIVDHFAAALLAVPLPEIKRAQLIAYLQDESGTFAPSAAASADRIRMLLHLLCSMPEYQLN